MSAFRIRRIRLLNFHNFVDETLAVRKNLFLIGDNQSGKTTVLDAVHFALSAGVDMEFNAAARFGPRNEPGRTLASIALRYDLERDAAQRPPSVMYAAVELEDEAAVPHTFGAGAFATSLDAQPDVWGFVARGKRLEDVDLRLEETLPSGEVRHRPRDRQELEQLLGRGAVFDKGRYRTALAQLLFRDRDAYLRALELISAGKAYRGMVARARNLDDLFIGLLPPPAEAEFEEIRSALRAIEGIRSDLADLAAELDVLRRVIEKLEEARSETEKIARYRFVAFELERRRAAADAAAAGERAGQAASEAARAEEARAQAAADVAAREDALRALRASEGAALLAREEEVCRDADDAGRELVRARQDLAGRQAECERAAEETSRAESELETARTEAAAALRSVAESARRHLDREPAAAVGALAALIAEMEPGAFLPPAIDKPLAALRRAFDGALERAAGLSALHDGEAARLRASAAALLEEADEVRRRAEVLPDLPGYGALLSVLEREAGQAVPLYRLFALPPEAAEPLGTAVECLLGPRILGAIVAPDGQHAAARHRVLEHGAGVEIVDPAEFAGGIPVARAGTLPGILSDAGPAELAALARGYLERCAGDVAVLGAGEERAGAPRAVSADGRLFENGAESRIDPGPPRFLGAEARARAAATAEARLREQAGRLLADAGQAAGRSAAERDAAASCRQSLDALEACSPAPLLARLHAAEGARRRLEDREEARDSSSERVSATETRHAMLLARHAELAVAIAAAGLSGTRERLAAMESELGEARTRERSAIDIAGRARKESDERAADAAETAARLESAAAQAKAALEELVPLVQPRYRADLHDYVFKTMRGQQILPENVAALIQDASNARARAFQWIDSSDGLRNQRLWQKYAFRLEEQAREVRDQAGKPVEEVYAERETEVRALETALDTRTRDLLERVVMAGLVRRLQGQVRELRETIQGINRLAADLRFGMSRFQFSLRQRSEFQRLIDLLREQAVLQPALREELRDFFQARLDDLRQAREGDVPEILDYRRWFEYGLQVQSRGDGQSQDLPRQRLRFGSAGEQAVPTYLLVLAVASLLYDRTDARVRVLLLDEAFLGIDAGRREVLLQFADRAGVDLIVATPELDGVTPALAASSTLFIEKTAEQDVFVSEYHWSRPGPQPSLFEPASGPGETDLVLGVRAPGAPPPEQP